MLSQPPVAQDTTGQAKQLQTLLSNKTLPSPFP